MPTTVRRALRDAGILFGVAYVVAVAAGVIDAGFDAHAYWAARPPDVYDAELGTFDAYLYSPAFAQLLAPLTALPWPAFLTIWSALLVAVYLGLASFLALPLAFLPPVFGEIHLGNIHLLLAAMIVLGFRWPALWSFALLTKVTPGIGLLWFAVRREWRQLAITLGTTLVIAAASFALAPELWFEWAALLRSSTSVTPPNWTLPIPLLPRLAAAAVLITWGGLTDRRWTVPVGVTIALPVVWGASLTVLLALVPMEVLPRLKDGRAAAPAPTVAREGAR